MCLDRGGMYASRGFLYQDYALVDSIFCFIDKNGFKGVEVETDNDFEIVNQNLSVQVKSNKETLSEISKVITALPDKKDGYFLYFSQLNNCAKNFFNNVNSFGNNKKKLTDNEIVRKLNIDVKDIYKVRRCKVRILPVINIENYLFGSIAKWLSKHKINSDINAILEKLLTLARKARTSKKLISKQDVLQLIGDKSYSPNFTQSLDLISYSLGFKADIISSVDSFIRELKKHGSDSLQLEQLKLLIISNNTDAMELIDELTELNPKYWILKEAVFILFGKKIDDNFNYVKPICGLQNFCRLVEGIKSFKNKNYNYAKEKFENLINANLTTNVYFLLGLTLYNLRDYQKAITSFQESVIGEKNKIKSKALTAIYMCKRKINLFYSDVDELIIALSLDASNDLARVLLIESYTDFGKFEETINSFDYLKLNNMTDEEKIGAYTALLVAEYRLESDRLHSDAIEFVNLLRSISPEKNIQFNYIGIDYIESFTLLFEHNVYIFSIGTYSVHVPTQKNMRVGIGVDITPCFGNVTLQLDNMCDNREDEKVTENFLIKNGSPTLFIFIDERKELNRILKQNGISINHNETREYFIKKANDAMIRVFLHQQYVTGDLKIGNYSLSFIIKEKQRGSFNFQKCYFGNPTDFLIELISDSGKFFITVPLESVKVEFK